MKELNKGNISKTIKLQKKMSKIKQTNKERKQNKVTVTYKHQNQH